MRVVARRREGYTHEVEIEGGHTIVIDEPARPAAAPTTAPPPPARPPPRSPPARRSPARCTPRARAGSWATVEVRGRDRRRAAARSFEEITVTLRVPEPLDDEQRRAAAGDRRQVPRAPGALGRDRGRRSTTGSKRRLMDLGSAGRACAVTGASRGIGLEAARAAVRRGRLGAARRTRCRGAGRGRGGVSRGGDRRRRGRRARARRHRRRTPASGSSPRPRSRFGQLDVLVNNAGTARWRDLDEVPDADWQAAWELNVMAPLRAMRAAAPAMAERGWGRIVNVSSSAGKRPSAMMPEYSVAKAAQLSLSRLYADRLRRRRGARERGLSRADEVRAVDGRGRPARPVGGARRRPEPRGRRWTRPARSARSAAWPRSTRSPSAIVFLCLGARLLRRRRRLVGRRRHGPGDHLSAAAVEALRAALLRPEQAEAMDAHGRTEAAVLVRDVRLSRAARAGVHRAPRRPPPPRRRDLVSRRAPRPPRRSRCSRPPCARPRRRSASPRRASRWSGRCRRSAPSSPTTRSTRSSA